MKLTQATVSKITAPPAGKSEQRIFDDDLPGFGLRVRAGGSRTWIIQYRLHGRSNTLPIGRVEKMRAAAARELARKKLAQVELGNDPSKEKKTARYQAIETFKTIAEHYLRFKASEVRASTYEQIKTHLTDHWASFNGKSVHAIQRRDIAAKLTEIKEARGPYAANRARSTLSAFFGWAMAEGIAEANPVIGAGHRSDETPRDRVLSDDELATVWRACKDDDYGSIIRLLILTGQRRDEVGAMARPEVDLAGRRWTIPAARTKNGLTHEVPLSDAALTIIKEAMERRGREERQAIFGESVNGKGFSGWSRAKASLDSRIKEATKKEPAPWRLHDIRRTVATRMAENGELPHVIEAILNHISGHKAGVAGVYNRATYGAASRRAMDLWASHVEALLAGKSASNVTLLRRGA